MSLVVDASALVDAVIDSPRRRGIQRHLSHADGVLAPEVLPVEVASALWRMVRTGQLTTGDADGAVRRLMQFPVELIPHAGLLPQAWRLRERVRITDGFYVALASQLGAPLLTTDLRLSRATTGIEIITVS